MRTLSAFLCSASLALIPRLVEAQSPPAPGSVVNGKVVVRVFVTLSDSATPYYPVTNFPLRFYRNGRDSATAVTDASGATSIMLVPGDYRLVSARKVAWRGYEYSWNVPIVVRPGMPMIDLRPPDSEVAPVTRVAADPARLSQPGERAVATTTTAPDTVFRGYTQVLSPPKDPATAFVLSFLLTGVGQIYAGETGRGVGMMLTGALGATLVYTAVASQLTCENSYYSTCDGGTNSSLAGAGLGLWLGAWIYSMVDAGPAARRYNAAHGFPSVSAVIRNGPHRTHQLGLAIAVP